MKAKVIATGEIVDVEFSHKSSTKDIYFYKDVKAKKMYNKNELVFLDDEKHTHEINWEQRRFELVKAALQGIIANPITKNIDNELVDMVILVADAVIEKLKEE